jgi:hypothetical protein
MQYPIEAIFFGIGFDESVFAKYRFYSSVKSFCLKKISIQSLPTCLTVRPGSSSKIFLHPSPDNCRVVLLADKEKVDFPSSIYRQRLCKPRDKIHKQVFDFCGIVCHV